MSISIDSSTVNTGMASCASNDIKLPPGTVRLIREGDDMHKRPLVMLDPVPSDDPNEPLNWSVLRKTVNFTIIMGMTCLVFTTLSVQPIFWQDMAVDLGVTMEQLNQTASVNNVGLAMGCALFIPFARKFGRRPVYIASMALMLATSFWLSKIRTLTELYVCNLLQGLGGATNEAITQITISDLFFVHHRGSMNGLYMIMTMTGSFLTPMAAGYQATVDSWRASFTTQGIFCAILLVLFMFCYEETKYTRRVIQGVQTPVDQLSFQAARTDGEKPGKAAKVNTKEQPASTTTNEPSSVHHEIDTSIPINSWYKRLAPWTPTSESIWPYFYRPWIILLSFPAVMFTALQYATGVIWMTIMSNVMSIVYPEPPYNFSPADVGYMSAGPFIGNLIGSAYGGFLGDWTILYFSRRNRGYYEPEMRLYILLLPALVLCGGIVLFGVSTAKGEHWIVPSVGGAMFGFGLGGISDASLTLVIDSYREVTGDAFVAIAFIRNAFSIGIPFAITPWIEVNGVRNMFVACAFMSLAVSMLIIPMAVFGKSIRIKTARRYEQMAQEQGSK